MQHFPILRTKKLTIQLKELQIGQAVKLAGMPEHLTEANCTEFLKYAIDNIDPEELGKWTVQERLLVTAHYLASISEDGPDFLLSDGKSGKGHFSDYFGDDLDIAGIDNIEVGTVAGENWSIRHLTGKMAESIERLHGEIDGLKGRLHWLVGSMAAQLYFNSEEPPVIEGQYDEWLLKAMRIIYHFPESEFELLLIAYKKGMELLHHFFIIDFDDNGIIVLPKEVDGVLLPPARFSVSSCLSPVAVAMGGEHV